MAEGRRGRLAGGAFRAAIAVLGAVLAWALLVPGPRRAGPRPPIIVISIDALRFDHLGCYGYERPTSPAIDAFAGEATRFERAFAPVGETGPSFASMLSGRQPSGHGLTENRRAIARGVPLLAEILARKGYRSAAFCANPVLKHSGLSSGFARFVYTDDPNEPHDAWDERVVREGLAWLAAHRDERIFLWLHFMEPHKPYQPAPPCDALFTEGYDGSIDGSDASLEAFMLGKIPAGPEDLERIIALYDGQVVATDRRVGRILEALRASGLYDRAVIAILADHGEELADHNRYLYHTASVYEGVLHIPLLLRIPFRKTRSRVPEVVRMGDFAPTILDLLEIPPPDPRHLDGASWLPLLAPEPDPGARARFGAAFSEHHQRIYTVRTRDRHFIYNPHGFIPPAPPFPGEWKRRQDPSLRTLPEYRIGREELYDPEADPREQDDILTREAGVARDLKRMILSYLGERAQRLGPEAFDEETIRILRDLGYFAGGAGGAGDRTERSGR